MKHAHDNHILFRRFLLVTASIAVMGILLAQMIAATHRQAGTVTVHHRVLQWQQLEQEQDCPQHHCALATHVRPV